jgi:hypothetical protein
MEKLLTDSDLRKHKYPLHLLVQNVDYLSVSALVRWQQLDADFCKKFILNEVYQSVEEQYKIDLQYVLKYQPHLTYDALIT